jgi:putative transposase
MFRRLKEAFERVSRSQSEWEGLLPAGRIQAACAAAEYQDNSTVYTASVTVQAFLGQLMQSDRSCQRAVAGIVAHRAANEMEPCSSDNGAFVKARQRIPEAVFRTLFEESGRGVETHADPKWLWRNRRVHIADGSTLQIADSEQNRAEYPLQKTLTPGCSYPIVRILLVFSFAVGTVLEGVLAPYRGKGTGETGLLRSLADRFEPGDVILGDRYFAGWWDIAFWQRRGVDLVTCLPASRRADFRKGTRLGPDDHLVAWKRTARPEWLTREEVSDFPEEMTLREVRVVVNKPGFRTKVVIVVTTLLDADEFPTEALAELYRRRWQAELNIRSLKTHMGMERLSTRSPEMVRKEFLMFLTAYNLVRQRAMEAASASVEPWQLSFKGTQQVLLEFLPRFHHCASKDHWADEVLRAIAQLEVGDRPDRVEPRALKKRPRDFPPLKEPRTKFKNRLRSNP